MVAYEKPTDTVAERKPAAVSLGCHVNGAALPKADPGDVNTLMEGVTQRMGKKLPPVGRKKRRMFLRVLKKVCKEFIRKRGIKSIHPEEECTIEEWLEGTSYPAWRKEELIREYNDTPNPLERDNRGRLARFIVKLFMKDEPYVDFKHARGIYAREDNAKIFFGPWVKKMEHEIYKQPEFIKHVPVKDRPRYIFERLFADGAKYIVTDYSSWEAHFVAMLMDACEFVFYKHFLKYNPVGREVFEIMKEVLQGDNKVVNKFLKATIAARRMSGEMVTSLGNGLTNLMVMFTICKINGIQEPVGVVEGDDGLFRFVGAHPTTTQFTENGFLIKLEAFDDLAKAGFCGNLFDTEDLQVVTDPYKVLHSFGWTTTRYLRSSSKKLLLLLRSKALSVAHQYPGCPIVSQLGHTFMRLTASFDIRGFVNKRRDLGVWERAKLLAAIESPIAYTEPGRGTRMLFEELYGISIFIQKKIEKYLAQLVSIKPLS